MLQYAHFDLEFYNVTENKVVNHLSMCHVQPLGKNVMCLDNGLEGKNNCLPTKLLCKALKCPPTVSSILILQF